MKQITVPFPPASLVWPWIHANCSGNPIVSYDEETDYVARIGFDNADDLAAFEAWALTLPQSNRGEA